MAGNRRPRVKRGKGLVLVDYGLLKAAIVNLGASETAFATKVDISPHTMDRIRNGAAVRPSVLKAIADYLRVKPTDLMAPNQLWTGIHQSSRLQCPKHWEWDIDQELGEWIQMPNGLRYWVLQLRHRQLQDRLARGKCYDLGKLATVEDERIRNLLLRHPRVCQKFRGHSQIPINLGVFPENGGRIWWLIDEWVPGHPLAASLQVGPLLATMLAPVMTQIAEGLRALHGAAIVRRELSPRNIILREGSTSVVLTDFEQSKLLDGSPTVAPVWANDPYRAPEVETSTRLDARADVYSWGRVFVHCALGTLPDAGKEIVGLTQIKLPVAVRDIVQKCVALPYHERPASIEMVLATLADWK